MKPWEIIRIIIFSIVGAALMFWVQRWVYASKAIAIRDVPVDRWLGSDYTTSALIVFGVCVLTTVLWYVLTAIASYTKSSDARRWTLVWWLFGLLPLASIGITVFFINRSQQAQLSLLGFFVLDALVLYWLPTATSSPEPVKYIPPGAYFVRHDLMKD